MKISKLLILLTSLIVLIASCQSAEEVKYNQYVVQGEILYNNNCANCHQKDGEGLAELYPAITNSPTIKNTNRLVCIMRYGLKSSSANNTSTYAQAMPENIQLQSIDLALIATYMQNKWGNNRAIVSVDSVQFFLKKCN